MEEQGAFCPSCGKDDMPEDVCKSCGFKLDTVLKCPNKSINGFCNKIKSNCPVLGMNWEICEQRIDLG